MEHVLKAQTLPCPNCKQPTFLVDDSNVNGSDSFVYVCVNKSSCGDWIMGPTDQVARYLKSKTPRV